MNTRIIEIDLLRAIAILMMITFHTAYDLQVFYDWHIDIWGDRWQMFRILTASLFLLVSGVATNFSKKPLKRSLIVVACALLISIVTYLYDPTTFIYFGILHCIGVGMLLLIPLKKFKEMNIILGLFVVLYPLSSIHYLSAIALASADPLFSRPTLDYYPLLPWFGLMLIGAGIGHYLYIRNTLILRPTPYAQILTLPSRYALIIYMVHQPIILAVMQLIAHPR